MGHLHTREQGGYCAQCFERGSPLTRHHIIMKSQGGSSKPKNLVGLCRKCHSVVHKVITRAEKRRWGTDLDRRRKFISRKYWREQKEKCAVLAALDRAWLGPAGDRLYQHIDKLFSESKGVTIQ